MNSQRPKLSLSQAIEQFEISRSTLRRGLVDGRFPGASKDAAGKWVIPIDALLQAGIKARKTWLNEGAHDLGHEPGQGVHTSALPNDYMGSTEHAQLLAELAHERAQREKAEALLEAEREHTATLKMAMKLIEAAPKAPEQKPRRWWNRT